MMIFDNKKVLIAGAGGLLGSSLVADLLEKGASVLAFDSDLERTESRLQELSVNVHSDMLTLTSLDITSEDQVNRYFKGLLLDNIKLDGAVNCTYPRNHSYGAKFFDVTLDSFNENVSLHLGSAFLFMRECSRYFNEVKTPFSLVNMASIYGVVAPKFELYDKTNMTMPIEYAAIKSAIIHLNKFAVSYMKDSNFRVNSVSPGGIFDSQSESFLEPYKNQTYGRGMLDVSDVLGSIEFLLSDDSRYMTGQNIVVDDGFTL